MLRTVETKYGKLKGLIGKDPRVTVFRGVPYAKAPVGELRWKAPEPCDPWEGTKTCYEYGPIPMMRNHPGNDEEFYTRELNPTAAEYSMSEDCLYLNIFSPAKTAEDNLPVFCYIHGGGYQDGYSYEVEFDGERIARRGVIVVMVSYRLGLFGFLAHPELTAETPEGAAVSNFGLQDQSAAIHWIYENIVHFGGDPGRITICGQSAGAGSVQYQVCSPYNEGLIAGAICQSSVGFAYAENGLNDRCMTLKEAEAHGAEFFEKAGIRGLREARSLSAEDLMKRVRDVSDPGAMFGFMFTPCIDGRLVTRSSSEAWYKDDFKTVPMMVGHCMGEALGGMFARIAPPTLEGFIAQAEAVYGDQAEEYLALCDVHSDDDVKALYRKGTFSSMLAGSRGFCELRSSMGKPVWYYIFDHDIPGDDAGSFHGSDLWFMFDSLANSWRPFEGRHYDLARQVASYWTNFVKYGTPNNPEGTDYNGNPLPEWKAYTPEEKNVLRFLDKATPGSLAEDPVNEFRLSYAKKLFMN